MVVLRALRKSPPPTRKMGAKTEAADDDARK